MSSKLIVFVLQRSVNFVHIAASGDAVQNVRLKHGIEGDTAQLNTVILQDAAIVRGVLLLRALSSSGSGRRFQSTLAGVDRRRPDNATGTYAATRGSMCQGEATGWRRYYPGCRSPCRKQNWRFSAFSISFPARNVVKLVTQIFHRAPLPVRWAIHQ